MPARSEQYQRAAEIFVEALLDPRKIWLQRWVVYKKSFHQFVPIRTWGQIEDGSLAGALYQGTNGDIFIEERFYNALIEKDRDTLVASFKKELQDQELTTDELARFLAITDIKNVKRSLKRIAELFKFQPGPSPPTRAQYDAALQLATALKPAIHRFLQQKSSGTKNTSSEIVRFMSKDFPQPCKVLRANLQILEACLADNRLNQRAKGIGARSRLLADAVAGSVHLKRKPSTAAEYLSAERRRRTKSRAGTR